MGKKNQGARTHKNMEKSEKREKSNLLQMSYMIWPNQGYKREWYTNSTGGSFIMGSSKINT